MAIRKAAIPVFSRVRDIVAKSLWLACASPLKVGLGRGLALACVRAFWKKVTWAASSFMISVNAFLIVAGVTLPRFCGDRKHKSDGIRVAKAEPLSASFSTTSARKRDSFASILNEGCTRPKRWLPCRQNGDVAHIYQILPCAKASLLIQ